jgi:hypothetical protein
MVRNRRLPSGPYVGATVLFVAVVTACGVSPGNGADGQPGASDATLAFVGASLPPGAAPADVVAIAVAPGENIISKGTAIEAAAREYPVLMQHPTIEAFLASVTDPTTLRGVSTSSNG